MVEEEVPETTVAPKYLKVMSRSYSCKWLPDFLVAYVKLNNASSVHMAPYINKVFNNNLEHDSMVQLRRVKGEGRCQGSRVVPPTKDEVAPGTPFATLVMYNLPSKGKCTFVGVFCLFF